jgi:hypothetical protein
LASRYFASPYVRAERVLMGRASVVAIEFRWPGRTLKLNTKNRDSRSINLPKRYLKKHQILANTCKYDEPHACLFGKKSLAILVWCGVWFLPEHASQYTGVYDGIFLQSHVIHSLLSATLVLRHCPNTFVSPGSSMALVLHSSAPLALLHPSLAQDFRLP